MSQRRSGRFVVALVACSGILVCNRSPSGADERPLATGRWTGGGACLSVTETGCNLAVGCGHGQFLRPIIGPDGVFNIDGTYRIEVGPISIEPAPPARFSGVVTSSRLTLIVMPSGSLPPASYSMTPATGGTCPIPCV